MTETVSTPVGHEAYAFACMRCGHGWEQAYEIEHHTDVDGRAFVVYRADGGRRVASPLSKPTCENCDSHVVRIMRSGQVSSVLDLLARQAVPARGALGPLGPTDLDEREREAAAAAAATPVSAVPIDPSAPASAVPAQPAAAPDADLRKEPHHWHLSDLLHPFRGR
ncbi:MULTISPECIES: hypothetical protein [Streptomyces]|uniref:C2H2-type domain-containing protein n=1 Tax=Streptomyces lichenis TaxID=2306967 RepID=A0ABT0IFR3_9ACTN|nr:hypothetical protein [Streptomyces lichenis]MCK8680172.1 hypothetical protein [Streptomyces lichenis]